MVLLNVPFADKDAVKALGARWNGVERKWFVPEGMPVEPFVRWMPRQAGNETPDDSGSVSLSSFIRDVALACNPVLPPATWVRAEVADFKIKPNFASLDLVEHDEDGNRLVSSQVLIWSRYWTEIERKIEAAGVRLEQGVKVLINIRADFSTQYGFRLVGYDIDPAFTIGEAGAKLNAIRNQLIAEGVYDRQRKLPAPLDYLKVAVISPENAAGLGDFEAEARKIASWNLCEFHYYAATFQGPRTVETIVEALRLVESHVEDGVEYDAVVIIRGGGAASDLAWLNDYEIARMVADMPIPVLSGLGHEKDSTIIDEVAHKRFDTPSKAVIGIITTIVNNATSAREDMQMILRDAGRALVESKAQVEALLQQVSADALRRATSAEEEAKALLADIRASSERQLVVAAQDVEALAREVLGLSPANTLQRGFAIARGASGRVITSAADAQTEQTMALQFRDGQVQVFTENRG